MIRARVFVTGRDGVGWSIDHDRQHAETFLKAGGAKLVRDPITASVIHSVWWPLLLNRKALPVRIAHRFLRKKIIGVVTNRLDPNSGDYRKAKELVSLWVTANRGQQEILANDGVETAWQPFYVDETVFKPSGLSRQELCDLLGIDYSRVEGRILIGNFQRDTLGEDLRTPKQQKDPERLVRILSKLRPAAGWLLVLAGPRRHYVISECDRLGIPYVYVGQRPRDNVDDLHENMLTDSQMALINNLIDCSVTTSQWEGGPKAIIEAAYTRTYTLCTPVGNAPDLLHAESIFDDDDEAIDKLSAVIDNGMESIEELVEHNYKAVMDKCSYTPTLNRWVNIYDRLAAI